MNLKSKRKNLADNIREVLTEKILSRELLPVKPLASNTELAQEFGVSLLTADRAVRQLVKAGVGLPRTGTRHLRQPQSARISQKGYRIGIGGQAGLSGDTAPGSGAGYPPPHQYAVFEELQLRGQDSGL